VSDDQTINIRGWTAYAIVAVTLCIVVALPGTAAATDEVTEEESTALFSNYLSGRFASTHRDTNVAASYLNRAVASDPDNIELVRQAFSMSLASGDYDAAASRANQLVPIEEQHTSLVDLVLIVDAIRQPDYRLALEHMENAGEEGIISLVNPLARAWIAAEHGDEVQAFALLDGLKASESFEIFGEIHEAFVLDYLGHHKRAISAYLDVLVRLEGTDLQVALAYGNLLERIGKGEAAKLLYEEFLKRIPENLMMIEARNRVQAGIIPHRFIRSPADGLAEAYFNTSRRLANRRSRSPALIYLRLTLMLRPDFPVAQLLLASLMERDRLWEQAIVEYEKFAGDPLYGWQARFEKTVLLMRMDRNDEALVALREMNSERPDDVAVLAALADLLRDQNDYAGATPYYNKVIEKLGEPQEEHWPLYYSRGVVLERQGKWRQAEKDFEQALALRPDEPVVLNYLGYSWLEQGKNLDEALVMIEKAVEKRPEDGYVIDSLGWALYQLKQYEESISWLEKAIILQPEDPTINDHLGDAYWRYGRRLEARFQWRHALVMKPESEAAERIRKKIRDGLPDKHVSGR
jgi:Flp pilus assembly protein TadD